MITMISIDIIISLLCMSTCPTMSNCFLSKREMARRDQRDRELGMKRETIEQQRNGRMVER